MDVLNAVYQGCITDSLEVAQGIWYEIKGLFDINSSLEKEKFIDIINEFQDDIENNPNNNFSLDFNGEKNCNGWVLGFHPCNYLDTITSLEEAKQAIYNLTAKFRDFVIAKGIICSNVTVKSTLI